MPRFRITKGQLICQRCACHKKNKTHCTQFVKQTNNKHICSFFQPKPSFKLKRKQLENSLEKTRKKLLNYTQTLNTTQNK